ncbi:hypothetical protein [Elioraea sp.]|uniref:hypothetical protein n=1 Tax=Elioraea sp. TaxID=2185103 RepID=UPI00307E9A93
MPGRQGSNLRRPGIRRRPRADQVGFDAQTGLAALLDPLWLGSGRACPSRDEAAEGLTPCRAIRAPVETAGARR